MSEQTDGESEGRSPVSRGRRAFDDAYRRADSFLDSGQGHAFRFLWFFLPETSVTRQVRFQAVFASRFFADAGQQALAYGTLIALVRGGGSTLDAALLGVAALLPPALLGIYGGTIADALPKRIALAGIYNLQALLCFAAPSVIGTDLLAMMALLFAVNTLGQVSGPSESAVIPLVATETQLASATSMLSLASTLGTAFGTALLAPVLVRAFGVETVIYVAGALLLVAASRVFDLPPHESEPSSGIDRRLFTRSVRIRASIVWLANRPAVATMIFVAAMAGTAQIVIQTLAPRYVQSVLKVDPANAVYVFAPSAIGLGLALLAMPHLIKALGERTTALLAFSLLVASLVSFGLVSSLEFLDVINPLQLLSLTDLEVNRRLRTAAFLALPLGFGLSLTATSVQTYINRRVPLAFQGRTFAMQSSLKNGLAIIPLVGLGAAAEVFGVENVLRASPLVLLALAVGLIQLSRHFGDHAPRGRLEELASYWEEPPVSDTQSA